MKQLMIRIILLSAILFGHQAFALETSFSAANYLPATDRTPYLTTYDADTLDGRDFYAALSVDYAHKPLRCNGCASDDIIRHLTMGHFLFSVGATHWLQIGTDVPVAFYTQFFSDTTDEELTDGGMGDVRLDTKLRLLDPNTHRIGLALLPFISLPTGDGSRFLGNGSVAGGVKAIADLSLASWAQMALNIGYQTRDNVTRSGVRLDDQVLYSLASSFLVGNHLDIIADVFGSLVLADFAESAAQSPLEADAALRYRFDTGWNLSLGGGAGLLEGVGTPYFRTLIGIGFSPKT